jgi:hypothetical protein
MFNMSHRPAVRELRTTSPEGHTIGFVNTAAECAAMTQALNQAGVSDGCIHVWQGKEGLESLQGMLDGSLWGESAEEVLKQGTDELNGGHFVACIEIQSAREAATVAEISTQYGCHGIYHFGKLVDTRLTR